MKSIFFTIAVLVFSQFVSANVRNVPSAYSNISSALLAAVQGDTILVDQGTYNENIRWPAKNNLKLISTLGPSYTIINGNGNGSVISMEFFASSVTIDTNTIIDGFQITGGYLNVSYSFGAGIYLEESSPLLRNLDVHDNIINTFDWGYGGGICCDMYSSPVIDNCMIHNNSINSSSWAFGGGIYLGYQAGAIIRNSDVYENVLVSDSWAEGGGISVSNDCNVSITKCNVLRNTTNGTWSNGSGILLESGSMFTIDSCVIEENNSYGTTFHDGAGISTDGTGVISNSAILSNSQFGTSSFQGAGIACNSGTITIRNCKIKFNKMIPDSIFGSYMEGGGLYGSNGAVINLYNSVVAGNAMEARSFHTYKGSGLYGAGAAFGINQSTIADNFIIYDSTHAGTAITSFGATFTMRNSISWNPKCKYEMDTLMFPTIYNSDVRNINLTNGNISSDPFFIGVYDYHLSSLSPCINAALLSSLLPLDLDGYPRPMPAGTNPDMGAYEADQPVGVNNLEENNQSSVFPNPVNANSLISLRDLNDRIVQVEIYNSLGQLAIAKSDLSTDTYFLHSANLKSGVYFYQLTTRSGKILKGKFVVN